MGLLIERGKTLKFLLFPMIHTKHFCDQMYAGFSSIKKSSNSLKDIDWASYNLTKSDTAWG